MFHLSQVLSDQLCVLTLPVPVSWSTCSRRAGCQQENSHITSALSEAKQAEKLRQEVTASLAGMFLLYQAWSIGLKRPSTVCFFISLLDSGLGLEKKSNKMCLLVSVQTFRKRKLQYCFLLFNIVLILQSFSLCSMYSSVMADLFLVFCPTIYLLIFTSCSTIKQA